MTQPALIFDFGNVLVHWNLHALYGRFFPNPQAVEAFLREVNFLQWNSRMDRGQPFAVCVADIARSYPQYAQLFHLYDERWADTLREAVPGMAEMVAQLKQAGYALHLLSNITAEKFPQMIEAHPVLNLFDSRILSGRVGLIKPDPRIFIHTLNQLGRSPEACLFIDDNAANVESARGVGIPSILFQSAGQLESELIKLGIL
ncbi:MAG: Alpha-D-glucose 1-phosphate phosphatase YihX [Anaerolineales bacterium]|nr:Alpha-D-glucose 1-phosphate phosphatase YihX [Anaerolineales bacterium]